VDTLLATAHTWRGGDGSFTLAPIVGLLLTLVLTQTILHFRIGWPAFAVAIASGALFATIGATWGFGVTVAIWLAVALLMSAVRAHARPFPRNASD
jgi:hypothetical protein